MAPVVPNPKAIRAFASSAIFEQWLSKNHDVAQELWIKFFKKGSGKASVTYAEALDVALCWGWIDGISKSYDEEAYLQRFTPRKAKSRWSEINRQHVARLIEAGRMTPHGQRQIDAAKADGRWDAAYPSPANTSAPDDLVEAIEQNPRALATFKTLNRQNLHALGYRLFFVKSERRQAHIAKYVAMLARGETIVPNGSGAKRAAKSAVMAPAKKAASPVKQRVAKGGKKSEARASGGKKSEGRLGSGGKSSKGRVATGSKTRRAASTRRRSNA